MIKRAHKRIPSSLEASFTLQGKNYAGSLDRLSGHGIQWHKYTGVIENISERGICLRTSPSKAGIDFSPGTALNMEFHTLSGEKFSLNCTVRWSNKDQIRTGIKTPGLKYTVTGAEITEPPSKYKKFIQTRLEQLD